MNLFIVEDNPIILNALVATLEELAPVRVLGTAADEEQAVSWLQDHSREVDVLIIDIFLRSGSGLGVLRAAAELPGPPRRVVLTNYATPEMRERCLALGADSVFDKSSDLDRLIGYCGGSMTN